MKLYLLPIALCFNHRFPWGNLFHSSQLHKTPKVPCTMPGRDLTLSDWLRKYSINPSITSYCQRMRALCTLGEAYKVEAYVLSLIYSSLFKD